MQICEHVLLSAYVYVCVCVCAHACTRICAYNLKNRGKDLKLITNFPFLFLSTALHTDVHPTIWPFQKKSWSQKIPFLFFDLPPSGIASGVTVQRYQENGIATGDSMALYRGSLDRSTRLYSLTMCARFKLFFLHESSTILQLKDLTEGKDSMLIAGKRVFNIITFLLLFKIIIKTLLLLSSFHYH